MTAVSSLLKVRVLYIVNLFKNSEINASQLYLRELPEPVFRFPLPDRIQHTEDLGEELSSTIESMQLISNVAEHTTNNFTLLRSKIRRLPAVNQATLKALVEHLALVTAHCEQNKMDPKNLAIVFGGAIFGEDELPKGQNILNVHSWKVLLSLLINMRHHQVLLSRILLWRI